LRPEIVISAEPLSLSTTALGMAIGLPAAFCVAVSLAALRYTLASEANTGLRLPGDRASAGSGSWGGPLVAAEVAMTLILVVGATVLIRTVSVLDRSPTGFDPERLLLADVQLPIRNASDDPRTEVFLRNLIKRISNLDGVAAVGAVSTFPLSSASGRSHDEFRIEGSSDPLPATMTIKIATPDYFRTAGIPLLAGRGFDEADSYERPRVALVNQRFVSRHFRNSDSLGRVLQSENGRFTIVGVIADVAPQSRTAPIESEIYIPHRQRALSNMTLVVKAKRDASALIPQVQSELRELDKTKPISNVRTGSEQLARSIAKFNLSMNLLVVSGVIALITALIGVTSVIAYSVHRRTREFAIRAALGATAGDVRRAAVRSTMMMTVVGLLLGTLIAFYASRWASSVAAGITQAEPLSFIGVGLFFTGASWIATLLVTRKALSSTLQSVLQRD
jgi:putative ABC transport system permease protein